MIARPGRYHCKMMLKANKSGLNIKMSLDSLKFVTKERERERERERRGEERHIICIYPATPG